MTPNDSNRDNIEPIVWLPEWIIDASEGRPVDPASRGGGVNTIHMLPPLVLDASAPPPSSDSTASG